MEQEKSPHPIIQLPDSVRKKELTTPAEIEPYQQKFFEAEGAKKVLRSNSEYSYAFIESEGYVIDKLCGTEETKLGPLYTSLEKDYGVRLIAWWRNQKLDNCGFIVAHTVESAEKLGLLPV